MSSKDIVLRKFLELESKKEIEKNRILANMASLMAGSNKEWVQDIGSHWNTYVSLELGMDTSSVHEKKELEKESLLRTYEKVKKVKVTARKTKDGKLLVDGLLALQEELNK